MAYLSILEPRDPGLWSQPPPAPRSRDANIPTLLFSWWCTVFAAVIICTRLVGRKSRSHVLFKEDWIMMLALVPLFIRMGFIHVVLLYGTNNVQTVGVHYTETQIHHRSIGARLVLAARIFYAMFIWTSKLTVSEFLKRITIRIWRKSYEWTLQGIRVFLFMTFFAVVIATLTECQPFDHYWQVVPDPGPQCRTGYANLITMGTCDIITDVILIAFPIPIILQSGSSWRRKLQLTLLFSLSIIMIAITATRVPKVIEFRGRQQYRTVWASCEILASTAVSNSVIIGSFLRDKGTKKKKYKQSSRSDSIDRSSARRPTMTALANTGSEEDLFRFLGIRVPDHLQEKNDDGPRQAPAALPATARNPTQSNPFNTPDRNSAKPPESTSKSSDSDDSLRDQPLPDPDVPSPAPSSKKGVNFFDVGGLLESGLESPERRSHGSTLVGSGHDGTVAHDFAPSTPSESRRGSRVLQDIGGLLTPSTSRTSSGMDRYAGRRQSDSHLYPPSRHTRLPSGVLGPMLERRETQQSLQDPGGLLSHISESNSPPVQRSMSEIPPRMAVPQLGNETSTDSHDFQDLGGLLSESHEPDASAAALERARARGSQQPRRLSAQLMPANVSPPTLSPGWEDMDIEDPGGLLSK